jgi:hypothetical protein
MLRSPSTLAARILADDTEEQMEEDAAAFAAWCNARGVECVRVLGVSEFELVDALKVSGDKNRILGEARTSPRRGRHCLANAH